VSDAERIEAALAASQRLAALRDSPVGSRADVWVVGGAIRDALAGRPITDVDLAAPGPVAALAAGIAEVLGGHAFELSDEFEAWRISGAGGAWAVDVAALRGPGIEADLRLRDLTVNAVAVPLAGGEPLDPCGGIADLEAGRLRAASPRSFADDPLRAMRAARIGAAFGLRPDQRTVELARAEGGRGGEKTGKRRFAELRGMVAGPDPLAALELLDRFELTPVVLPQLAALRGVGQSANHHLDVHGHTIEVLRRWLEVEADLERFVGPLAPAVAAALAEPMADGLSRREGIRFAAILHDIGKPATRTEHDGHVGFRGHDAVGAEMVRELCMELRTSRRFADYLAALTRHHLVLGFLTHARPLSRRRIWDYIERTGREALDVTMLTIADRLSAQGWGVTEEAIEAHLELAREMLEEIVVIETQGPPRPLLDGAEIATSLAVEGPLIGEAVGELRAAQFAGEVGDREDAERHLHQWLAARGRDPDPSG
jgi:poly(A) polymerase